MQTMNRKIITSVLLVFTFFSITACSPKKAEESREQMIEEATSLPDTEIKIPSSLIGSEADYIPESSAASATVDEDNNISYQLDGNTRAQILNALASDIENSIAEILADKEYYPNIADITVNADCTEFTVYLTTDTPNLYESTLLMSFYTLGDRYQIYNGVSLDEVKTVVVYLNQTTGTELSKTASTSVSQVNE